MELKSNNNLMLNKTTWLNNNLFYSVKTGMYLNTMDFLAAIDETFKRLLKK